jgi:hypothetical protein
MPRPNGAMLNQRPIFVVGFQRGGTNIVLNLLLSHPGVCMPRGELHFVFRGKRRAESWASFFVKTWRYLPILLAQRQDVFAVSLWQPRRRFTPGTIGRIDRILFYDKPKALEPEQNLYRSENVRYTHKEIVASRLACKYLNGLIFLTDELYRMYPDATFVAVVRNALALCEGHVRRGVDPATIADLYDKGCQQMIAHAQQIPNYHIIRFEDVIDRPLESLRRIYECAGLDIRAVEKVRLQSKKVITEEGKHEYVHGAAGTRLVWYDLEDFGRHFLRNVNIHQMRRLSADQERIILDRTHETLKHFDYLVDIRQTHSPRH